MSADPIPGVDWPEPAMPPDVDPETLSADRRRTIRQQQNVSNGIHPLTLGPIHNLATTQRAAGMGTTDPYTCGTCTLRVIERHNDGKYPKCHAENALGVRTRVTGGPGTDVRAWWPACPQYEPTIPSA